MKEKYDILEEYVGCECHRPEHLIRFIYCQDEDLCFDELYTSVFLPEHRFFARIWLAIKYVCGFKSRYGYFSCTIISPKEAGKIKKLIDLYIERHSIKGS